MHLFLYTIAILALRRVLAADAGCGIGMLPCDSGKECIQSDQWCDGTKNCEDESDEAYCKKAGWWNSDPNDCIDLDTHFWCSDGICVPISARCNNNKDCKDNSDEEGCEKYGTTEDTFATTEYKSDIPIEEKNELTEKQKEIPFEDEESTTVEEAVSTVKTTLRKQSFEDKSTASTHTTVTSDTMTFTIPSAQVHPHWPSSSPDYYDMRMKEADNGKKSKTTAATLPTLDNISSESYSTFKTFTAHHSIHPLTTPIPQVRRPVNVTRPAVTYPSYSTSTHTRRPPTHDSHPRTYYSHPQTYDSSTRAYDSHQRTYDSHQRTYDSHQRTYDTRQHAYDSQPTYNNRQPTYDSHPRTYDGHPHIYDSRPRTYDGRQLTYNSRSSSYNSHPRTDDNHPSIFANRPYHPNSNQRPRPSVFYDNRGLHTLNGEPEKSGVAILRPYNRETEVNKPFYFAKNYAELYDNNLHLRKGESWLLRQRRDTGDWGKDTARALAAFALVNNSFLSVSSDNELMKRRFMVQLSIDLLRNTSKAFNVNRMAMAMNALLAVCENPRDFHGLDLTEVLRAKIREHIKNRAYLNPFVYLSLCLAGKSFSSSEVQNLMKQLKPSGTLNEMAKDMQIIAIQAFACYLQQSASDDHAYQTSLREALYSAVSDLLQRTGDDGSFGSVYSTALAAQALISVNNSGNWNAQKTLNFLKSQQREDGSFGDLLATYYALPALSGRSLLYLRNIHCKQPATTRDLTPSEILEFAGPRQYVHYSVYFGHPLENSHSVRVLVPQGINFLDVMRVAEYQDKNFRFAFEDKKKIYVYSISGIPNDSERGFFWHLYVKRDSDQNQKDLNTAEQYNGNIKEYFPRADEHVIFWYHPTGLRN